MTTTQLKLAVFVVALITLGLWAVNVFAGGAVHHNTTGGTSSAAAAASVGDISAMGGSGGNAAATVSGGGSSANVTQRAIGLGSTGLTATATCLGSFGVAFNAISGTYVEQGCVHRTYMFIICSRAADEAKCFFDMACLDPDASPEMKRYIGCKE